MYQDAITSYDIICLSRDLARTLALLAEQAKTS